MSVATIDFAAHFKVVSSRSGEFNQDAVSVAEGVTSDSTNVVVDGVTILLPGGDERSTLVTIRDAGVGIAFAKRTPLNRVDVNKLTFTTNSPVDPNDLLRSVGVKR